MAQVKKFRLALPPIYELSLHDRAHRWYRPSRFRGAGGELLGFLVCLDCEGPDEKNPKRLIHRSTVERAAYISTCASCAARKVEQRLRRRAARDYVRSLFPKPEGS